MTTVDMHGTEPVTNESGTQKLASSEGLGSITMCGCGTLSLNVQAMSLRLDAESFAKLLMMCSDAMYVLEALAKRKTVEVPAGSLVH